MLGKNRFVLKHQASQESGIDVLRPSYDFFGRPLGNPGKMDRAYNIDTCIRSRLRPAAYLLPKGVEGTTEAAEILAANGAAYYEGRMAQRLGRFSILSQKMEF